MTAFFLRTLPWFNYLEHWNRSHLRHKHKGRERDGKNRLEYHWNLPDNSNTSFMKTAKPTKGKNKLKEHILEFPIALPRRDRHWMKHLVSTGKEAAAEATYDLPSTYSIFHAYRMSEKPRPCS